MDDFFGRAYIIYCVTGDNYEKPVEIYFGSREGAEKKADWLGKVIDYDEIYEVSATSYPIYREMFKDEENGN